MQRVKRPVIEHPPIPEGASDAIKQIYLDARVLRERWYEPSNDTPIVRKQSRAQRQNTASDA